MRTAIITMILLALSGCKSGQFSIPETSSSGNIPVSLSLPADSKIILIDPEDGQKKEFVLDSTQNLEFFVKKDSMLTNNIYKFIIVIGSLFLGFLAILTSLEFFKKRRSV